MKRLVLLGFLWMLLLGYTQGQQSYNMSNGTVTISCPQTVNFYDPGGPNSNYSNNSDYTQTFVSSNPSMCLQISFTSFELEYNCNGCTYWDWLEIYDGMSVNSPRIGDRYGGNSQYGGNRPQTITSTSGALTFKFHSDGSTNKSAA